MASGSFVLCAKGGGRDIQSKLARWPSSGINAALYAGRMCARWQIQRSCTSTRKLRIFFLKSETLVRSCQNALCLRAERKNRRKRRKLSCKHGTRACQLAACLMGMRGRGACSHAGGARSSMCYQGPDFTSSPAAPWCRSAATRAALNLRRVWRRTGCRCRNGMCWLIKCVSRQSRS